MIISYIQNEPFMRIHLVLISWKNATTLYCNWQHHHELLSSSAPVFTKKNRIPNFNKKFHVKILKVLKRILRINSPIRWSFAFFSFIVMVLYIRNKLIASDLKKIRIGRFGIGCWIPWARYLRIFLSGMLLLSLNLSLGYCWLTFDKFITL